MHTARVVAPLVASITIAVSAAFAGTGTGTISGFIPGNPSGTAILVFSTTAQSDSPSCNTSQRFAISSTNPTYKDTVAAVLEAYATGASINAVGLGTCNVLSNAEDLSYICVGSIPC
jgi:hypothetical protein